MIDVFCYFDFSFFEFSAFGFFVILNLVVCYFEFSVLLF